MNAEYEAHDTVEAPAHEETAEQVARRTAAALERGAAALERIAYACETGAIGGSTETGERAPMTLGMMVTSAVQQLQALVQLQQQQQPPHPPGVGGPRMPRGRW